MIGPEQAKGLGVAAGMEQFSFMKPGEMMNAMNAQLNQLDSVNLNLENLNQNSSSAIPVN